ncbi:MULTISPECIES: helix-hairpin-helix domain-containing protein [unclassified Streptomyces]|uniref:helix-hairpin-helix domain-containing protein n=1 Tax=unclassified Streptomyces TaxID=2593676 RepID=UPI0036F5D33F
MSGPEPIPPDLPQRGSEDCGRFCTAPDELQDALGHDSLGHLTARRLRNAEITTVAELRALSPAEIVSIRGLGKGALERIEQQGLLGDEFRTRKATVRCSTSAPPQGHASP